MKRSIIVPVYNEEKYIVDFRRQLTEAMAVGDTHNEHIYVNDGPTDSSVQLLKKLEGWWILPHIGNRGYSATTKTGK